MLLAALITIAIKANMRPDKLKLTSSCELMNKPIHIKGIDTHVHQLYLVFVNIIDMSTVTAGDPAPTIDLNEGNKYFKDIFPKPTEIAKHAAKGPTFRTRPSQSSSAPLADRRIRNTYTKHMTWLETKWMHVIAKGKLKCWQPWALRHTCSYKKSHFVTTPIDILNTNHTPTIKHLLNNWELSAPLFAPFACLPPGD
jgi:hypothetical protein